MDRSVTVLDDKGPGEIMIILAVLNILASGWLKNIPSIVLTLLTIIVAGIVINTTLEDSAYFSIFEFGAGFYMLIAGTVLLVASFPIFYLTTKKQPTALRGVEKVKN
jgi:hypothetical protein